MGTRRPGHDRRLSRRDLFRTAASAAGAAALTSGAAGDAADRAPRPQESPAPVASPAPARVARGGYEQLTAAEADVLEAVVARLIPTDETGPGALDAGATRYIDRGLGGALAAARESYRRGLPALDAAARTAYGTAFAGATPAQQDALLTALERGDLSGTEWPGGPAAFFALLKAHTWQGTFGDPFYGGNANFAGWDLLRYPGVRTYVSEDDQRRLEGHVLTPVRRSAYDDPGFSKATARLADGTDHQHHGD